MSTQPTFEEKYLAAINSDNDGSNGQYRCPAEFNMSNANTDRAAIASFLSQYSNSPATLRTYEKESERFHMWAVMVKNKSIADLGINDYQDYIEFLRLPDPAWVSVKKVRKTSPDWRPFTIVTNDESDDLNIETEKSDIKNVLDNEGLSDSAIKVAMASISSLLSWMVSSGYLRLNPLSMLRQKDKLIRGDGRYKGKKVERFIDNEMWDALTAAVERMPKTTPVDIIHYERVRFMLSVFSMVGARVHEISKSVMSDFHRTTAGWFWKVVGKGSKDEIVALPQDMLEALMRWRKALGLPAVPTSKDNRPIMPALNKSGRPIYNRSKRIHALDGSSYVKEVPRAGLTPRHMNMLLKELFENAAKDPLLSEDKIVLLKKASAHWLRHTSVTQKLAAGMDRGNVQKDARHSDARTTGLYSHDEEGVRSEDAQKHRLRWVSDR